MSATDEELQAIRIAFGAWLVDEIVEHDMTRPQFIERVGFHKGTVSRWITGTALPRPDAIVAIARTLRMTPDLVLAHAAGEETGAVDSLTPRLPPNLSKGESRLLEHLAWAVRHWRVEQNELGEPGAEDVA